MPQKSDVGRDGLRPNATVNRVSAREARREPNSKRSLEEAERIPGLHVYMVNCLSHVEVRARLWGFRSDNGDVPGMRFASSGLRLLKGTPNGDLRE